MSSSADAMQPKRRLQTSQDASVEGATFKRVYQACESCRQKKQKCSLGDPANPKLPCDACRRASLPCGRSMRFHTWMPALTAAQFSQRRSEKVGLQRHLGVMLERVNRALKWLPQATTTSTSPTCPIKKLRPSGRHSQGLSILL